MRSLVRLSTVEYEDTYDLVGTAATLLKLSQERVRDLLRSAGERVAPILKLPANPVNILSNAVNIGGIAGLLRVAPRLELEIVPKCLSQHVPRWREDFFYLSMLSRHGRLLASERLASSSGSREDLATLVGRAVVGMFWDNYRRPLRTYRRARLVEFAIDGDVDAETLVIPSAEGYEQEVVAYDRRNVFNATLLAAVQILLHEVRDPQTRQQLMRISQVLAPQRRSLRSSARTVPSRSQRWQPLYDLSWDIVKGFGVSFNPASTRSPGFILDTWRVWEDVVTLGLRLGLGAAAVQRQQSHVLGFRDIYNDNPHTLKRHRMLVYPDISISSKDTAGLLVDAKYKTRMKDSRTRIAESDVYEALAFSLATGCKRIVLAYPARGKNETSIAPGTAKLFERIIVGQVELFGIEVEIQGISQAGALRQFAQNISRDIYSLGD